MRKENLNKIKTAYHHGNLKEELLKNALQIINKKGEENLTLKLLADKLNISPPALYRHFQSKNDLINHVIAYGFDRYDEIIISIDKKYKDDILKKLYFIGDAYINFAKKSPNLFKILFGKNFHKVRDIANREEAKGFYILVDTLAEAQEKNIIKKEDSLIQASIIHSTVHGLATLYINNYTFMKENIEVLYDCAFETILSGILINQIDLKKEIKNIKNNQIVN